MALSWPLGTLLSPQIRKISIPHTHVYHYDLFKIQCSSLAKHAMIEYLLVKILPCTCKANNICMAIMFSKQYLFWPFLFHEITTDSAFHSKLLEEITNDFYEFFGFICMDKMGGTSNNT